MKICMVIGNPVNHSLSPFIHNAGYKALGIENQFVYKKTKVKMIELENFINSIKALQVRGVSLTMPHKLTVMKYLDHIDKVAEKIGAVNTIVNNNGVLTGYNTDWLGIIRPIQKLTDLKKKKVAIIGAGGAARASVYGFLEKGARVTIFNRTDGKAQDLAKEFGCQFGQFNQLEQIKNMDILFNATSVGMKPNINKSSLPKDFINNNHIVFDAIYTPFETQLLKEAKAKGARVIHGMEMLLYQGIAQFELFTGEKAPIEAMRKALEENINV